MIEPIKTEQFEALEAEHGYVYRVETPLGDVYVRRAKKSEIQAFQQKAKGGANVLMAQDELAVRVVLHPSSDELKAIIQDFALFSVDIAEAALAAAKGSMEARAKKP